MGREGLFSWDAAPSYAAVATGGLLGTVVGNALYKYMSTQACFLSLCVCVVSCLKAHMWYNADVDARNPVPAHLLVSHAAGLAQLGAHHLLRPLRRRHYRLFCRQRLARRPQTQGRATIVTIITITITLTARAATSNAAAQDHHLLHNLVETHVYRRRAE